MQHEISAANVSRIRPGVKALILHEGKVLVIEERVDRDGQEVAIWDFPGGGIERGEALVEALQREVFEEVGLQVQPQAVIGAWQFFVREAAEDVEQFVQILCIGYQCCVIGSVALDLENNPAVGENITAAHWLTPEEILSAGEKFENDDMLAAVRALGRS